MFPLIHCKLHSQKPIDEDNLSVWVDWIPLAGTPPVGQKGKNSLLFLLSRNTKNEFLAEFCSFLLIHFARS